ncbi:MAG: hydrolase [Bacteroidota bacterium]
MNQTQTAPEPCCPKFDTTPWDEKTHQWQEKLSIKDTIPQIFHIPLPGSINRTISRMWERAQQAGATPDLKDFLILAYDPSPWKCEYYLSVTKEVPGAVNVKLTGTFLSKVFDGPYQDVPKWLKVMDTYVTSKGESIQKYYFYFTTCPKCAKIHGHNYVVAFAQVG